MPTRKFGSQFYRHRNGLSPGTLLDMPDLEKGSVRLIRYGPQGVAEDRFVEPAELPLEPPEGLIDWVQVKGVHDADLLGQVGARYGIHTVTLEDLQNTDRRPSFESTGDMFYLTAKRLKNGLQFLGIEAETVGVLLRGRTVITFLEHSSEGYSGLESRLWENSRLRASGADYLVFRIWDQSMDSWLLASEIAESHIQDTEEEVLFNNHDALLESLHKTRQRIAWLRWMFLPYRELRSWIAGQAARWFSRESQPFLNDLADHAARVQDLLDVYRNMVVDLFSVHMSILSVRLNSVMKVLTIIATIFIPLTFIAGIYGMNFHYMPELNWRWAYPAALLFMVLVAAGMIIYIRRKKWF